MSIINRDKKTFSSGLPLILKYDGEVILYVERGCRMLTTYDLDELEFFVKRSKDFIKKQ